MSAGIHYNNACTQMIAAYIQCVEDGINNYPREMEGFKTSDSLFDRRLAAA